MGRTAKLLDTLVGKVRRSGGRVVAVEYSGPTLIALIPRGELEAVSHTWPVGAIEPAPAERPMGALANETAAVGAPTWWSHGHLGGTGSADAVPASLAIMDDKIQEDQPLLAGVHFESPQGSYSGTFCGQASAGCEHGTEVAGMAVATGNAGCTPLCTVDSGTEQGIAYGVAHVLDADITAMSDSAECHYDSAIWAFGVSQPPIGDCTHSLPGALHPAYVHSDSHGSYTTIDDGAQPRNLDKFASTYGAIETEPSGNDGLAGAGAGHITSTCDAYNVICVGGIGYSDNLVADFSSRGPSPGGRKKPDIVGIAAGSAGGANMTVLEQRYSYYNRLERGDTGTSFASPQVAGAAALLYGAGLTDPLVVKAILIDSTTLGRATPSSAMGTQTTWQPDWGWGELNLASAYDQRLNFAADAVPALGVHFYRATVNAGDRATLVWNRRVVGPLDQVVAPTAMTLSNLDLYQYDPAGANQASSESAIDNVEQVRGTGSGQVIYKVKDQSTSVDGLSEEPFALAAANPLTPLAAPVPRLALAVDRSSARRGEPVTLTATLTNASAGLAASGASVALNLPAGVRATDGDLNWTPGALPAGATLTHTWTLTGDSDSSEPVSANASADAFGETFRSAASVPLTVDSSPPSLNLACGHTDAVDPRIGVVWSATDASAVAGYQLGVSTDGGPFVAWRSDSEGGSATFTGSAGHSYAVELSASDSLGNVAAPVRCGPLAVGFAPLAPILPSGQSAPVVPASPRLRLTRVTFRGSRLIVRGSTERSTSGRISGSYSPRGAARASAHGRPARGRYTLSFRLTRRQLRVRRGVLRIYFAGDAAHAPQRLRRSIARRR